ncbi:MAG: hemolysin III family protein [Anaerolineales bacterium]
MNDKKGIKFYSPLEEKINVTTHAAGLVLSVIALVLLVTRAIRQGNIWHVVSFSIFGVSLCVLYAASTFYHNSKEPELRSKLRVFDHASIYVLIAGTYTPYTIVTLNGLTGWVIFGISWGLAISGIILKLFFTGKYDFISTLMYVFMGWIIIFAIKPLLINLSSDGIFWLIAGGISYTLGAVIYSIKKIKFNHAIFHIFVLFGSGCHFLSIFLYV